MSRAATGGESAHLANGRLVAWWAPVALCQIESSSVHNGTYRILKSGCYYLSEDIEFEPNGRCCDYWVSGHETGSW